MIGPEQARGTDETLTSHPMAGISDPDPWTSRRDRWRNAWIARRARFARASGGFSVAPEPRTIGSHARGRRMMAGWIVLAGHEVEAPGVSLWDIDAPSPSFAAEAQGFGWLDDLAAASHPVARKLAQDWVFDWIGRFGRGAGPGWTPQLSAQRLTRWIDHGTTILAGRDDRDIARFHAALGAHTAYLARQWHAAPRILPRFETLSALVRAALTLKDMDRYADPAVAALAAECEKVIGGAGTIPTRNPEELLGVLVQLNAAVAAMKAAGRTPPAAMTSRVEHIVPLLRALRHADGGLARFHGGGRGADGKLDRALSDARVRAAPGHGLHMGYARLSAGRTSVIADAAPPPRSPWAGDAHASTLAFEATSGRRPLIVNCGSGTAFGAEWGRAGKATPSHSALCIEGLSSARIAKTGRGPTARDQLVDGPMEVWCERSEHDDELRLSMGHDGWVGTHGLFCRRELTLTADGRALSGLDLLEATTEEERRRLDAVRQGGDVAFSVNFHLHPDASAMLDPAGTSVSVSLRSGEVWVFRHDGSAVLSLRESVYLDAAAPRPVSTMKIMLSGRVAGYEGRVNWTLAKTMDTPSAMRDLTMDDPA